MRRSQRTPSSTHQGTAAEGTLVRRTFLGRSLLLGGGALLWACGDPAEKVQSLLDWGRGAEGGAEDGAVGRSDGRAESDGGPSSDTTGADDSTLGPESREAGSQFQVPAGAYVLAAKDSSSADKQRANEVCPGTNDDAVIGKHTSVAGKHVFLLPGTYYCKLEAHIYFGAKSTLQGASRQLVKLVAKDGNARVQIGSESDNTKKGVTLRGLTLWGYWALNNYCSDLTCENVWIQNTLDGVSRVDAGNTGAFQNWCKLNTTLSNLTFRGCVTQYSSHHGFGLHLITPSGAPQEGGGFENVLFEDCWAISSGHGKRNDSKGNNADWSCGFDIPDTGDIKKLTVRRCVAYDAWQDGFHLDGSWDGHRQTQTDLLFEDCLAYECGKRCWDAYKAGARDEKEKFLSGYYLQNNTTLRNCVSVRCPHSGFVIKHESGYVKMQNCTDFESGYSLDIEYFAGGWTCEGFTSVRPKTRALSATCSSGTFTNFRIFDPPSSPRPVRLGVLERVDFRDCKDHAAALASMMKTCRPMNCSMQFLCNTITQKSSLIEVNSSCSSSQVNLSNTTVASLSGAAPTMPAKPKL